VGETIIKLNLGCGLNHKIGWVNVDNWGEPDLQHDLNTTPFPWDNNSIDEIEMNHVLEHIPNWWDAFAECSRILKVGGTLQINVPDESSGTALTYRDHHHVFSLHSFHGTAKAASGTNLWAATEEYSVPLEMVLYARVPYKQYNWMTLWGWGWLLSFCAKHLRNFIHEQRFTFIKIG